VNYISELVVMGGGFEVTNSPNGTEYNFSMDAEAVRKVLASPVKKIFAPLDMTHKLAFSLDEIDAIVGTNKNVFTELFYLNYETAVKHGESGAVIHDASTVAYLLDAYDAYSAYRDKKDKWECEIREHNIVCDSYGAIRKDSAGCPVKVIENINKDFMRGMLRETFNKLAAYLVY